MGDRQKHLQQQVVQQKQELAHIVATMNQQEKTRSVTPSQPPGTNQSQV